SARRMGRRHHYNADRLLQGATIVTFLLGKWLQAMKWKAAKGARTRHGANRMPAHRCVLGLEALESRCLLSSGLSLTPSEAAPQLAGERIVWTATASDLGANPVYQFRVG